MRRVIEMTDYSGLVHRLRIEWGDVEIGCEAADAIEALENGEELFILQGMLENQNRLLELHSRKRIAREKNLKHRIAELEAVLKPFAAYYLSGCNNLDPDYCVISEADEEENNLTVGLFRAAHKALENK